MLIRVGGGEGGVGVLIRKRVLIRGGVLIKEMVLIREGGGGAY